MKLLHISGFTLTSEYYGKVVKILEERFGNTKILINVFTQWFVSLTKIKSANDISALRKSFLKVEINVRYLKTLSVEPDTYGSLLVPLINKELSNDVKLSIVHQFGSNVWSLSKILEYLKKEIGGKERATLNYSQICDQNCEGRYPPLAVICLITYHRDVLNFQIQK